MHPGVATLPAARGWQVTAVDVAVAALTEDGRGQIRAACGTERPSPPPHVALRLCPPDGLAVVACPSLALLAQTLGVWAPTGAAVLAVCGDNTVVDTAVHSSDLPAQVSTDPATIADWLHTPTGGLRLVAVTHRSADQLGAALRQARRAVDILVVDEAHYTAGARRQAQRAAAQRRRVPRRPAAVPDRHAPPRRGRRRAGAVDG
jgi:predicted helicase